MEAQEPMQVDEEMAYANRLENLFKAMFASDDLTDWSAWVAKYNAIARVPHPLPIITGRLPRSAAEERERLDRVVGELRVAYNTAADVPIPPALDFHEGTYQIGAVVAQLDTINAKIQSLHHQGLGYGLQAGGIFNRMKRLLSKDQFAELKRKVSFKNAWINFLMKIASLVEKFPVLRRCVISLHQLRSAAKYLPDALAILQRELDEDLINHL